MALLLLLSTTSWKVEKHYCMGHLVDVALFTDVEVCGMNMSIASKTQELNAEKSSCCDDQVIFIEGQDDLKISLDNIDIKKQFFFQVFTFGYDHLFQIVEEKPLAREQYPPPLLVKNIQLLDQVFLI